MMGRPSVVQIAVEPEETCPGAFFTAETARTFEEARHKPFESNRRFAQPPSNLFRHLVDHATAHHRLADGRSRRPVGTVREQVPDGHSKVVIRVHQPCGGRHDSVPVGVRIVSESHLILVFEANQARHCVRAGAVHSDLAIVIDRHE
jgi:hypothetical protein